MKAHFATFAITLLVGAIMAPANAQAACIAEYKHTSSVKVIDRKARFQFDDINLRAGPGVQYCVVRVLQSGAAKPLQVTHHEGNWLGIVFEGEAYWVHRGLLAKY